VVHDELSIVWAGETVAATILATAAARTKDARRSENVDPPAFFMA
jgi:hypothetical protein